MPPVCRGLTVRSKGRRPRVYVGGPRRLISRASSSLVRSTKRLIRILGRSHETIHGLIDAEVGRRPLSS